MPDDNRIIFFRSNYTYLLLKCHFHEKKILQYSGPTATWDMTILFPVVAKGGQHSRRLNLYRPLRILMTFARFSMHYLLLLSGDVSLEESDLKKNCMFVQKILHAIQNRTIWIYTRMLVKIHTIARNRAIFLIRSNILGTKI